jgi:hypothetical protein
MISATYLGVFTRFSVFDTTSTRATVSAGHLLRISDALAGFMQTALELDALSLLDLNFIHC